jgi:hypothetical protein
MNWIRHGHSHSHRLRIFMMPGSVLRGSNGVELFAEPALNGGGIDCNPLWCRAREAAIAKKLWLA